jgi:hypothetical protein
MSRCLVGVVRTYEAKKTVAIVFGNFAIGPSLQTGGPSADIRQSNHNRI